MFREECVYAVQISGWLQIILGYMFCSDKGKCRVAHEIACDGCDVNMELLII